MINRLPIPSSVYTLRKELHQHPELSGEEHETAERIIRFIEQQATTEIIRGIGGYGVAALYTFSAKGPTIIFRCELDALPIAEVNAFTHKSVNHQKSHKCGHDGHMAIVAGLAPWLKQQTFQKGKVVLLFQPAEENGAGAYAVLSDNRFRQLNPDYMFALHNLPGKELHHIFIKENVFTATVQSVAIYLNGKHAHASEPENGINPAPAVAELIQVFAALENRNTRDETFALLTPICINMGEKAYGISAEKGEMHYTLRTWSEATMQALKQKLMTSVEVICRNTSLQFSMEWFDYFPATVNNAQCTDVVRKAAVANNYHLTESDTPFRFGEDFGWFSKEYKTALFGLGAGVNSPALHHNDYDFPDEIMETGINMFTGIITKLLQ